MSDRPIIEYVFRILNTIVPGKRGLGYNDRVRAEHMFNMLNNGIRGGKNSPMVRKFVDSASAFFHGIPGLKKRPSYLVERMGLTIGGFEPVGLRIAFVIWQPVLIRIRSGKD
jgi:hypothetical protein